MKRTLLAILVVIIVIPILLVLTVVIFVDPLVRVAVEKGGTAALKVPVHLKSASIRFSGNASLTGFEVGNPGGFAEPQFVRFDQVDASVHPSTLFREVIEVDELRIVKPDLTLEFAGTKSNLSALMDNLKGTGQPAAPEKQAPGRKFIIHKLTIEEAGARFRSDLIAGGAKSVTLPTLTVENVGTAEGGATFGQLLGTILQQLGTGALKAGQGIVPTELLNDLGSKLGEGVKTIEQLPSKSVEELKKQVPDKNKVEKGVKDFLHQN
jgi:hypothetical protein